MAIRVVLAAIALVVLFDRDNSVAALACVPVVLTIAYWLVRRRKLAPAVATGTPALEHP